MDQLELTGKVSDRSLARQDRARRGVPTVLSPQTQTLCRGFGLCIGTLVCCSFALGENVFFPIDLSGVANFDVRAGDSAMGIKIPTFPGGTVTFAGVPFRIASSGNTCWNAHVWYVGTVTMDLPTNIHGAVAVHTLISTIGGQYGPASYASIEFSGSQSAVYRVDLVGGTHIRDWHQNSQWTTTLTWPSATPRVWSAYPAQIDVQRFELPAAFAGQNLIKVRLVDSGHAGFQRSFISAVTVERLAITCVGDLNGDNVVDDSDFQIFASAYDLLLCSDPVMPVGCPSDFNSDAVVDDSDFILFVGAYDRLLCP